MAATAIDGTAIAAALRSQQESGPKFSLDAWGKSN